MRTTLPLHRLPFAAAALAAAALAVSPAASQAAPKPGFVPGTWNGSGTTNGTFTLAGNSSPTSGKLGFSLTISKALKASGKMTLSITQQTEIAGLSGTVTGRGVVKLSGTSTRVHYEGSVPMEGRISDGKVTIPFRGTVPLSGDLVITRAGCAKVVGKTNARFPLKWTAKRKGGAPAYCS